MTVNIGNAIITPDVAYTWTGVQTIADDVLFRLGTDGDTVLTNQSTLLAADEELTSVIVGTSEHPGVAANSLLLANITSNSDILLLISKGGHSQGVFWADGSTGDTAVMAASGASIDLYVAGTKEYEFTATEVDFNNNDLDSVGHMGLGDNDANARYGMYYNEALTVIADADNNPRLGAYFTIEAHKTASAFTGSLYGGYFRAIITASNTQNWTHAVGLRGVEGVVQTTTGTAAEKTLTGAAAFYAATTLTGGANDIKITNYYGLYIEAETLVANNKLTNDYGIYIGNQAGGATLNYAIYTNAGLVHFGDNIDIADTKNIQTGTAVADYYDLQARKTDATAAYQTVARIQSAATNTYIAFGGSQQNLFYNSGVITIGGAVTCNASIDLQGATPNIGDVDLSVLRVGGYTTALVNSATPTANTFISTVHLDSQANAGSDMWIVAGYDKITVSTEDQGYNSMVSRMVRMDIGKDVDSAYGIQSHVKFSGTAEIAVDGEVVGISAQLYGTLGGTAHGLFWGIKSDLRTTGIPAASGTSAAGFFVTTVSAGEIIRCENLSNTVQNGLLIQNSGTMTDGIDFVGTITTGINMDNATLTTAIKVGSGVVDIGDTDYNIKIAPDKAGIYFGDRTDSWDVLLLWGNANEIRVRNALDNAFKNFRVENLYWYGIIEAADSDAYISVYNVDNATITFRAWDNDANAVAEVAKMTSADDPYFSVGGSQETKFYNSGNVTLEASVWLVANIPTSDPSNTGQIWSNSGVLTVS